MTIDLFFHVLLQSFSALGVLSLTGEDALKLLIIITYDLGNLKEREGL
jgi:hypothetical protein